MSILHATSQDFDSVLKENKNVLVDFWATWCGPCRMVAPIMEQVAEQFDGKIAVVKVDVDAEPKLAERFGIQSIPTVALFQDGQQVFTDVGARPLEYYVTSINENLK